MRGLYIGTDRKPGLLADMSADTLVIDCSTIDPASAQAVAAAAAEKGIHMIDAPVSGGTAGAQNGTLTFIVGGPGAAFDRAKPILEVMGANIFHAGEAGAGQVAKICNNMLLSILMAGVIGLSLVILADPIGIGNRNGFGMRQALGLSIPSYLVFYGLYLLFKK